MIARTSVDFGRTTYALASTNPATVINGFTGGYRSAWANDGIVGVSNRAFYHAGHASLLAIGPELAPTRGLSAEEALFSLRPRGTADMLIDPQLDANVLIRLRAGDPTTVAYARANQAAGLSYNFMTRFEYLAGGAARGGTRADLRVLEETYGIQLRRDISLADIESMGASLRASFAGTNRILHNFDSEVLASAYLRGERVATGDLQLFKRGRDLGINIEFVGNGRSAQLAAQYRPQPVPPPNWWPGSP